jgi:hypothetical protein
MVKLIHIDWAQPIFFRYDGKDYECLYMGSYLSKEQAHHIVLRNKAAKGKTYPTVRVLETYNSWGVGITSPMKVYNPDTIKEEEIYDNYRSKRQSKVKMAREEE